MKDNQLNALIDEVSHTSGLKQKIESSSSELVQLANQAGYKLTNNETKDFLSKLRQLTQEDETNMPPLVVLIMAYLNLLFPEYENTDSI